MSEYEIVKVFVASTAHIEFVDSKRLGEPRGSTLIVRNYEYGFDVFLGYSMTEEPTLGKRLTGFSNAFRKLVTIALENDCEWLRLDQDGQTYDGLETFDW